ncbi:MAG: hypothetical protein OXC14_07225, partial [Rhodospirillaceae bacterium]|nr:hypothetical protein [Rhodospirillaceae bacterium]
DKIRAGTLTATEIANSAGLIRSQRIVETIQYANGASVLDWDYEVTRLTGVSIVHPQIVFNVTKIRIKNSESGALTPGSVQTAHIALGATSELYVYTGASGNGITSRRVAVPETFPVGTGFTVLVQGSVTVASTVANQSIVLRVGTNSKSIIFPATGGATTLFAADELDMAASFSRGVARLFVFSTSPFNLLGAQLSVVLAKR